MFKSICNVFRSISDATYAMSLAAELAVEKSEKRLADYKEEAAKEAEPYKRRVNAQQRVETDKLFKELGMPSLAEVEANEACSMQEETKAARAQANKEVLESWKKQPAKANALAEVERLKAKEIKEDQEATFAAWFVGVGMTICILSLIIIAIIINS